MEWRESQRLDKQMFCLSRLIPFIPFSNLISLKAKTYPSGENRHTTPKMAVSLCRRWVRGSCGLAPAGKPLRHDTMCCVRRLLLPPVTGPPKSQRPVSATPSCLVWVWAGSDWSARHPIPTPRGAPLGVPVSLVTSERTVLKEYVRATGEVTNPGAL